MNFSDLILTIKNYGFSVLVDQDRMEKLNVYSFYL